MPNITRPLAFADAFIAATLVEDAQDFAVEDAIVVNLSPRPMVTGDLHPAIVPA